MRTAKPSINVLLPYEFTLLSNFSDNIEKTLNVLLPYEFTLLSNMNKVFNSIYIVLLPYEFTLLSNRRLGVRGLGGRFYYLMNLHYSQTRCHKDLSIELFYYLMNLHYSQT